MMAEELLSPEAPGKSLPRPTSKPAAPAAKASGKLCASRVRAARAYLSRRVPKNLHYRGIGKIRARTGDRKNNSRSQILLVLVAYDHISQLPMPIPLNSMGCHVGTLTTAARRLRVDRSPCRSCLSRGKSWQRGSSRARKNPR